MKYRFELMVNNSRSEVWQAFEDPEMMRIWQPSLTGTELVSGSRGQPRAGSKLTFKEMVEGS